MKSRTIAFIGGGNMASSLMGGLIAGGWDKARIRVADPQESQRRRLRERFGLAPVHSNEEAAQGAEVIVLAVKPALVRSVAQELGPAGRSDDKTLFISIAAGVREGDIRRWLGYEAPVVRAMPNTPALVGSGASALYANPRVSREQRSLAESVMRAVGMALWVDEEPELDAVTALSGSGPAYFFLVLEALQEAAVAQGLDAETARLLALETAFGAAKMALESPEEPAALRARVTSPGGTTERAIAHLEQGGLRDLFAQALEAARARAAELGDELGAD